MAHIAHENEVRGREELAKAVRETEQHIREELGREIAALTSKAEEDMSAEQRYRVCNVGLSNGQGGGGIDFAVFVCESGRQRKAKTGKKRGAFLGVSH